MANSKYKAPNGSYYLQNDIDYLMNNGYSLNGALDALSQSDKYRQAAPKVAAKSAKTGNVAQKLHNAAAAVKKSKFSKYKAPNGSYYEQNDIDYLKSQGYSDRDAIDALSKSDKYRKKTSSAGGGAQKFSGSSGGGRRTGSGGGSSGGGRRTGSGGGSEVGRAAGGGAAALAAQEAYAQYQETGDIEIIDAFLV